MVRRHKPLLSRRIRARVSASEALVALTRGLGQSLGSREPGNPGESALHLAWSFAAGGRLQQHVHPIRLVSRRLRLRAPSAHWAAEVRRHETTLLQRLAACLGEGRVRALEVEIGPQGA